VAPETTFPADVHAHMHREDLAHEAPNQGDFGPGSASARATRDARVIREDQQTGQERPERRRGRETDAAVTALAASASDSGWARPAMTPIEALYAIAPATGEASNWIIWLVMTAGGLARAFGVGLGYLITAGFETRIRAGVATTLFLAAVLFGCLAG
jgi:hypothetical protein